jgi:transposase-like protein
MTRRKQFSAEFKREAVRLLETSKKQQAILPENLGFVAINSTSGKINSADVASGLFQGTDAD